jgi:hypothetical protein
MRNLGIAGITLLIGAVVAPAAVAAPKAKRADGDKVICRELGETGSRLATKRICLTRDQWREQALAQRTDLDKAQRIRVGPDGQ